MKKLKSGIRPGSRAKGGGVPLQGKGTAEKKEIKGAQLELANRSPQKWVKSFSAGKEKLTGTGEGGDLHWGVSHPFKQKKRQRGGK